MSPAGKVTTRLGQRLDDRLGFLAAGFEAMAISRNVPSSWATYH
jgi:hypothetical protein